MVARSFAERSDHSLRPTAVQWPYGAGGTTTGGATRARGLTCKNRPRRGSDLSRPERLLLVRHGTKLNRVGRRLPRESRKVMDEGTFSSRDGTTGILRDGDKNARARDRVFTVVKTRRYGRRSRSATEEARARARFSCPIPSASLKRAKHDRDYVCRYEEVYRTSVERLSDKVSLPKSISPERIRVLGTLLSCS